MPPRDACRVASAIMVRPHTKQLDGEGVCTYRRALLDRIRTQIGAGVLSPPDTSGTIRDHMPVEPGPDILADCAACGERFTMLVDQSAERATALSGPPPPSCLARQRP